MKIKRIAVLFLAVLIAICAVGCRRYTENTSSLSLEQIEAGSQRNYLTLLYSMSDTFNPYTVKTAVNRQLCQLIYDPLVRLDNSFNPIYCIAKSAVMDGNKWKVTLNSYTFSDGSAVTAEDVVYSYNLAKASATAYASKLYEVSSVATADTQTVVFNLIKQDPYFVNVLNFPIIKKGSESIADSDSVLQPPVGCGKYKVNDSRNGLIANEGYYGGGSAITEIRLINAPDTESVSHYAQVGAADMYYNDISDGTILRMSGKKLDINLNSLVYIGINSNIGALTESALRQALSSGIDRTKLCQNVYYNNATPANGFFHPAFEPTKSVQNIQIEAKSEITIENLEKIGYNRVDSKGIRINGSGIPLKLTMLVNSENRTKVMLAQLISSQLRDYGIEVTVIEKSYAQLTESLANGNFQLFLGEIKLTENMDISSMVVEGGSAAFGLPQKKEDNEQATEEATEEQPASGKTSGEVVSGFYSGQNSIADIAAVLQSEMPFVPICYRKGVLFYNDNIENVNNSSESDIYFSIKSYIYVK